MVEYSKIRTVKDPIRSTYNSAGIDFYFPTDMTTIRIPSGESVKIPSGIKMRIPSGYFMLALNKSGVCVKTGLVVGACLIDEDYQGEIHIHLINTSNSVVSIFPGQKAIQFVLIPTIYHDLRLVSEADLFDSTTERGTGGFGSTGLS